MCAAGFPFNNSKQAQGQSLYDILGVARDASSTDIKKAYKRMALQHHPDRKGEGNEEMFQKVQQAYEILSDNDKRRMYDQTGSVEGVESGQSFMNQGDIYDMIFGGGGFGGRHQRAQPQTEDVTTVLKVSLEQLYSGCTRRMRVTREKICRDCKGKGGMSVIRCNACDGRGARIRVTQMGVMQQRVQFPCDQCNQTGEIIPENSRCKSCKGSKTISSKEDLEIHVPHGAAPEHRIVMANMADEYPGAVAGDLTFVLEVSDHKVFKRINDHLVLTKSLTLEQAILGTTFTVKHLNGKTIALSTPDKTVVNHGASFMVRELGMKQFERETVYGCLVVIFEIAMPLYAELSPQLFAALESSKKDEQIDRSSVEFSKLIAVDSKVNLTQTSRNDNNRSQSGSQRQQRSAGSRGQQQTADCNSI